MGKFTRHSKPLIYTILEVAQNPAGTFRINPVYVAADSSASAVHAWASDLVNRPYPMAAPLAYVQTDEGMQHAMDCGVSFAVCRPGTASTDVSQEEFSRWVRVMTWDSVVDGQSQPAVYRQAHIPSDLASQFKAAA